VCTVKENTTLASGGGQGGQATFWCSTSLTGECKGTASIWAIIINLVGKRLQGNFQAGGQQNEVFIWEKYRGTSVKNELSHNVWEKGQTSSYKGDSVLLTWVFFNGTFDSWSILVATNVVRTNSPLQTRGVSSPSRHHLTNVGGSWVGIGSRREMQQGG